MTTLITVAADVCFADRGPPRPRTNAGYRRFRNKPLAVKEMGTKAGIVYLMRGLPACGKSHMAKRLAASAGVVLETDEFFYTQVGDDPTSYDYREALLPAARAWNFDRFQQAISASVSPIVVDRGNGLNPETKQFAAYAVEHGYQVKLHEPDSPWWQELRVLLKYKAWVDDRLLDAWAQKLADATRGTHRVPSATIRHWMSRWRFDLTVEEILNLDVPSSSQD